jgi:hypothetical protein
MLTIRLAGKTGLHKMRASTRLSRGVSSREIANSIMKPFN